MNKSYILIEYLGMSCINNQHEYIIYESATNTKHLCEVQMKEKSSKFHSNVKSHKYNDELSLMTALISGVENITHSMIKSRQNI